MKNVLVFLFLSFAFAAYSQVITEEQLNTMVVSAQEKCVGAHESIVQSANEEFAKSIWNKQIRLNNAKIIRFFTRPSGEKVSAGVEVFNSSNKGWGYSYDQKGAADLLTKNGVKVTTSYNTLYISANQNLLYAESVTNGHKTILELYCPYQKFLEVLRTGQTQSIEFLVTGYRTSVSSDTRISGVLTQVYADKQVVKCSNGHEFDKALGYKFCPTCGEPLK
jgi:hypothetical protein